MPRHTPVAVLLGTYTNSGSPLIAILGIPGLTASMHHALPELSLDRVLRARHGYAMATNSSSHAF